MPDPFMAPASDLAEPASGTFSIRVVLFALLALTFWLFTSDVQFWFAVHDGSLEKGARISTLHFLYLKLAAVEIAWFRVGSGLVALGLVGLMIRDLRYFGIYGMLLVAYGVTHVVYLALSISGVLIILSQVAGAGLSDTGFWLSPAILPVLLSLGLGFAWLLVPSIAFFAIYFLARSMLARCVGASI
jgi:hypothetical protein